MLQDVKSMPRVVFPLCLIKILSTFSYAILFSSTSLFLTHQLGLTEQSSYGAVALFLSFNFLLQLVGSVIGGGGYISYRSLFILSTMTGIIGLALLGQNKLLYVSLSLAAFASGIGSACFNCLMTSCFMPNDTKRETAFFLSYSAANLGFILGFIVSGFFAFNHQYLLLFKLACLANVIKLIVIRYYWGEFKVDEMTNETQKPISHFKKRGAYLLGGSVLPLMMTSFYYPFLTHYIILTMGAGVFILLLTKLKQERNESDRENMRLYLILGFSSLIFWMIYYTGPMGVTLFIEDNVNKQILGFQVATQWLFNINALVIIIGAPLLAFFFEFLRQHGKGVSISTQFFMGLVFLSFSFFVLAIGIHFSDPKGYSPILFSLLHFIFQGGGELFIAPVGYAMVGKLAPKSLQGLMMGAWMMLSGIAVSGSHYFSNWMSHSGLRAPIDTNATYGHVFNQLGLFALMGGLMLILSIKMNELLKKNNTALAPVC
jgi:POT family proton-dependent oligopeptide transporter